MAHSAPGAGAAPASSALASKQVDQQAQVVAALQITEIDWHKGGFNNMMLLNMIVQTAESKM